MISRNLFTIEKSYNEIERISFTFPTLRLSMCLLEILVTPEHESIVIFLWINHTRNSRPLSNGKIPFYFSFPWGMVPKQHECSVSPILHMHVVAQSDHFPTHCIDALVWMATSNRERTKRRKLLPPEDTCGCAIFKCPHEEASSIVEKLEE